MNDVTETPLELLNVVRSPAASRLSDWLSTFDVIDHIRTLPILSFDMSVGEQQLQLKSAPVPRLPPATGPASDPRPTYSF